MSDTSKSPDRHAGAVVVAAVGVGIVLRIVLLLLSPAHGFLSDHLDFLSWSTAAYRLGPTRVYDVPPNQLMNTRLPNWLESRRVVVTPYPAPNACNYPPLAVGVLWVQGWVWHAMGPEVVSNDVDEGIADYLGLTGPPMRISSPVANTVSARFAMGFVPLLGDFLLAAGVYWLARRMMDEAGGGASERAGLRAAIAFAVTLLSPVVVLNAAFWGQMDSLVTAAMVWSVYLLVTLRPGWAGVAYGAALMLKPQAILLTPVLLIVAIVSLQRRGAAGGHLGVWRFPVAAIVAGAVIAGPFMLTSRGHVEGGAMRWFERSYRRPIVEQFPMTTVNAFNVWWLERLWSGESPTALDPRGQIGRASKSAIGFALFAAAIVAAAGVVFMRRGSGAVGVVALAGLVLLAAFAFPTRVHERYIYYCTPFLIAACALWPRWIPAVVAVSIIGAFETTWFLWLASANSDPLSPPPPGFASAFSGLLAVASVAAFVYAVITVPGARTAEIRQAS